VLLSRSMSHQLVSKNRHDDRLNRGNTPSRSRTGSPRSWTQLSPGGIDRGTKWLSAVIDAAEASIPIVERIANARREPL
jgi:hypothetical protein